MGTTVLIQQRSIDKYCFWQSPRDYIYTSASLEISKNVQPKLVGPQLVIPGSGTAGRDDRGQVLTHGMENVIFSLSG